MSIPRKVGVAFVSFLAVAGLIGAACSAQKAPSSGTVPQSREDGSGVAAGSPPPVPSAKGDRASLLGEFQIPGISQKIIKTATVTVQVRKGTFQQRFQQAAMVATAHAGFVSTSRSDEGKRRSGLLVIRIPAAQFESAMGELRALGTVKSEQVSGQDVTAQFVDLEARLRNWEAQEAVLLRLMRQSKTIEDSLKVQRTLQDVQLAIEEIRGQLRVLSDQTDLSTITLSMAEAGPGGAKPKNELTFFRAWHQAVHAIAAVFAAVVIGLGYAIPVALIALALVVVWLAVRRLRPRVAGGTPSGTA